MCVLYGVCTMIVVTTLIYVHVYTFTHAGHSLFENHLYTTTLFIASCRFTAYVRLVAPSTICNC